MLWLATCYSKEEVAQARSGLQSDVGFRHAERTEQGEYFLKVEHDFGSSWSIFEKKEWYSAPKFLVVRYESSAAGQEKTTILEYDIPASRGARTMEIELP
jgi:hypothetical protein